MKEVAENDGWAELGCVATDFMKENLTSMLNPMVTAGS